jgi:DNA polymerase-3 subunit alpha
MGTTRRKKRPVIEEDLDAPVESIEVMWHWLREGWKYRGLNKKLSPARRKEYSDRVKYEVGLIADKDFVDYFITLAKVLMTAKDRGVAIGPARGSSAASLVCYLLRLTEIDPMEYPLMLFERFIDPNRFDLPDIDTDIEDDRRDEVRQIMIEMFGADRVGNIGTFTRYRGKNSLEDVGRVYSIPKAKIEAVKEFVVERSGGDARFDASLEDTVEMFPEVKEIFDEYPDLYRSLELEGNFKTFGVHAAGLVVGAEPLWKYVATYSKSHVGHDDKTVEVLSVDKYDGEHLGLLKLDALGLTTMGMIARALRMLNMSLEELYDIPMDDPATMEAFRVADLTGIFQFEGRTMRMVTEQMKPTKFMDLAALNALARPGPMHGGSTGEYLLVRDGRKEAVELHPIISKICEATEGQIIYQEQILQITREVGRFPWTHASKIRKIISSKAGESAFNAMWGDFKKGAAEGGIDEATAREIWKRMATAGTYAFNIAHCISYSMLGVWAMWLKVHHPEVFYAAQLHKLEGNADKRTLLMRDMQSAKFGRNLKIMPPAPGESDLSWIPVEGGVRAGFLQIPGIGLKTAKLVQEFDDQVGITEWKDLLAVKGIGPGTIKKIEEFASDPDPFNIAKMTNDIAEIKAAIKSGDLAGLPMPKATSADVPYDGVRWGATMVALLRSTNLQDIYEYHRSKTGEELLPENVKGGHPELSAQMGLYMEDEDGLLTVKVDRFLYPQYEKELWNAKPGKSYIVFVAEKYPFPGKTLRAKSLWVLHEDD